jgi:carbonic anhydrase
MRVFLRIFCCAALIAMAGVPFTWAGEEVHWAYEGEAGPESWGKLSEEFDMCARGKNQSPIDLVADIDADLPELIFDYTNPGSLVEVNTGHAIQENVRPGNHILVDEGQFELKQFHFHSPSEHLVDGVAYPMETHWVHQSEEGEYVVVGLLFEEGETNPLLNKLPSFRAARGEDPFADPVDVNELVRDRSEYFLYNGSLTTPPCTEGVKWIVLKRPVIASPEQIQHYHDLLGFDNNRPIQPRGFRLVLE